MSQSIKKFDIFDLDHLRDAPPYRIGRLTGDMIALLNLNCQEKDIFIWRDRLKYIEKHRDDYTSDEQYRKHVLHIPDIVQNPDYIGKHPSRGSIEFIKQIDVLMLVAVRLRVQKRSLYVRSAYPIRHELLEDYLKSGTTKKWNS